MDFLLGAICWRFQSSIVYTVAPVSARTSTFVAVESNSR